MAEVLPGATLVRVMDVIVRVADVGAARAVGEVLEIGIEGIRLEARERTNLLGRLHVAKVTHDCLHK